MYHQRNESERHTVGRTATAVGCLLVGCLTACSGPTAPADRAGGDTVVLRLATSDGEAISPATNQGPFEFIDALEAVSGGRLQVEIQWDYASGAADAETQVVEAIASGEVDGGWPATRAFARAGIEGLEAIEAPMLLTSEAAVEELVTGEVAGAALTQLDGTGVTGVGLMAAPLRRPVSGAKPIVSSEDWKDATFRVYNSPVQAAAVRALGARPVNMTHAWRDAMGIGDLDGAELDVNGEEPLTVIRHITGNVVLWPKVSVASVNTDLFDSFTEEQQEWVREAARRATAASVDAEYDASSDLQPYCNLGTQVHEASTGQVAALREAVAPVVEDLRHDPETAELMTAVDALAARHPDTDVPSPVGGCEGAEARSNGGLPTTVAPIADGTYRAEISEEATADVGNGDGWGGTWTMQVRDGTFAFSCRPLDLPGVDCGHITTDVVLEAGYLKGDETKVWFVDDAEVHADLSDCELPAFTDDPDACFEQAPYAASWQQDGDVLTFTDSTYYTLTLAPWQKVAD